MSGSRAAALLVLRLLQHLLIWSAACAVIVVGMAWGHAIGFNAYRLGPRVLAWTAASATLIFAAALVQRAPVAILALVVCSIVMMGFGAWLVVAGARASGVGYMAAGATYAVGLAPQCVRWYQERRT